MLPVGTIRRGRGREAVSTGLVAALALAPAAVLLWPRLPPFHEDEILPLVPLIPVLKQPEAYGAAFLANHHIRVLGFPVALVSYVIEGPLKALCYTIALPLTRAAYRPEHLIGAYRASNLFWTWGLFAMIVAVCRRLSGWRAALLCLALLVPDHSLVYLGVTDIGRPNSLTLSLLLLLVTCRHVDRPRWRTAVPVALVVFVGTWTRLDFVWFVAAAVGGCLAADLAFRRVATLPVVAGATVGLGLLVPIVPQYFAHGAEGHRIPLADVDLLWRHLSGLLLLADPWGTYHRQFDVGPHLLDPPYVAYRWAYLTLCLLVLAGLGTLALRRRRPANLVLAAFPALVLAAVVETEQAYEVHHIVNVKPALYVAASVLAAELARARRARAPVLATWAGLALGALWVDARAFTDLATAAPPRGLYWGVTWNMSDAWQAAARSPAKVVFGADFGVWVPGALSSPPDQRWESSAIPDEAALDREMTDRSLVGFVFLAGGPNTWLLTTDRYPVVERRRFDAHPGDPWALVVLAGRPPAPAEATPGSGRLGGPPEDPHLSNSAVIEDGRAVQAHERRREARSVALIGSRPDLSCARDRVGTRRPLARPTTRGCCELSAVGLVKCGWRSRQAVNPPR